MSWPVCRSLEEEIGHKSLPVAFPGDIKRIGMSPPQYTDDKE